mmetsp:Transcript_3445/g.5149  ORF Transcript_3445/g.5149 Transcript_3445/m.5149 type:complete len:103 (+) Transcript_3445:83-391(+)
MILCISIFLGTLVQTLINANYVPFPSNTITIQLLGNSWFQAKRRTLSRYLIILRLDSFFCCSHSPSPCVSSISVFVTHDRGFPGSTSCHQENQNALQTSSDS